MTEQFKHINVTDPRARRLTYERVGKAILEETGVIKPEAGEVTLKTLFSGISRGTEALVYQGKVPASEWARMRCPHMHGDFSFPVSYGYACVTEVLETGSGVTNLEIGDRVFVLHPHQDFITVEENACIKIPEQIPANRAVLAANMETAINAVWDAEIEPEQTLNCAVVGGGVVGMLTAYALRDVRGVDPLIIDINPEKRNIAVRLGFKCITPEEVKISSQDEFDLIFNTSASAAGLQFAIDNAAFEGKIVEMSWYGEKTVSLNLGGGFHVNRLRIISSQVGTVARSHRDTIGFSGRLEKALLMLDHEMLDVLLEEAIDFQDLPDHLEAIFNSDRLCQVVQYS